MATNVWRFYNLLSSSFKKNLSKCRCSRNHRMVSGIESIAKHHCTTRVHHTSRHLPLCRQLLLANDHDFLTTRTFLDVSGSKDSRRREFNDRKLVGFSMQQMYSVVSDVENYKEFVPFCKRSNVQVREKTYLCAHLVIGFPPIIESYTSHVTLMEPNIVYAECRDATLFNHLQTNWKFTPGLSKNPQSCVVNFHVSFEFKSIFHSHLANIFFNELVKQMEKAFITEVIRRYGKASIPTIKLKLTDSMKA